MTAYFESEYIKNAKHEILTTAMQAVNSGLMAATSGNFSVFDPTQSCMVITPSGYAYDKMTEEDLIVIDLFGNVLDGFRKPSSEWKMHAEIYRMIPHINAIVHTHSPYATAFAVLRKSIPCCLVEAQLFLGGKIEVADYAAQGTAEVGIHALPILRQKPVCLLANHGIVSTGKTLSEAYTNSVYVEDSAKICHLAMTIGTPVEIEETHNV